MCTYIEATVMSRNPYAVIGNHALSYVYRDRKTVGKRIKIKSNKSRHYPETNIWNGFRKVARFPKGLQKSSMQFIFWYSYWACILKKWKKIRLREKEYYQRAFISCKLRIWSSSYVILVPSQKYIKFLPSMWTDSKFLICKIWKFIIHK